MRSMLLIAFSSTIILSRALFADIGNDIYSSMSNLSVSRVTGISHLFSKPKEVRTWSDLVDQVSSNMNSNLEEFQKISNTRETPAKALFVMNFVHRLWPPGNPEDKNGKSGGPGCAYENPYITQNADTRYRKATRMFRYLRMQPKTYLEAPVACCNDYAMLLYIILNELGIKTEQVGYPGHIYNEIEFGSNQSTTKMVLDGNLNIAFWGSNNEFLDQHLDNMSRYIIFSSPWTNSSQKTNYRSLLAAYRLVHIPIIGRLQKQNPIKYDVWNQFKKWIDDNYVTILDEGGW